MLPLIVIYSIFNPQDRKALLKRLSIPKNTNCDIWLHACSVGEVNSLSPLLAKFKELNFKILLTTTTITGFKQARKKWPNLYSFVLPFDIITMFWILNLKKPPKSLIIVETEIWPGIIFSCYIKKIKLILVNARLSDKSLPHYKKIAWFLKPYIKIFKKILSQSELDAKRFNTLFNYNAEIMPNLKFWVKPVIKHTKNHSKIDYIIAGSTHKNEEELIIKAYLELKKTYKHLGLIIAPRHLFRLNEIENILKKYNLTYTRWSQILEITDKHRVILVDTIGELLNLYSISRVIIIGGSFVKIGGHNPIEALFCNKIPIIGPYYENFKNIVNLLKNKDLIIISNKNNIIKNVEKILNENYNVKKIKHFLENIEKLKSHTLDNIIKIIN